MVEIIANRYRIISELGKGGMGTVYKGEDTHTGEVVAIKHLKPELTAPELIERFKREGEALRELNHPNIVMVLDAVEEHGNHYLIIEYLSGGDLNDLLKQERLSVKRVLPIAIDICDALTRAHKLGIIHRDLKPANVLLAEDGTPRLTDFGVAHIADKERMTQIDAIVGTFDYLAPEIFEGATIDPRTDIWAFGVMLFEMLAGERPFKGDTLVRLLNAITMQSVPDLEELCPTAPTALIDLVYRMLEKDPHARVSSVRHVGAALEDILQGRSTDSRPALLETRFATPISDRLLRHKHNLPAQTTLFVGRGAELSELTKLMDDPKIRLVTIVAQGGMGKTRLGLEVARRYVKDDARAQRTTPRQNIFSDGVYFVELAPLSDSMNIIPAIAEATSYQFQLDGREQKQQLLDFLSNKNVLLLMDNYEHLMTGATLVTDILKAAPAVQILATSRQKLNQSGETVFNLQGMDFPAWETPADALEYAAVKLFIQSAKRVLPDFEIAADNLDAIARICMLVQGMPLGILLAASWLSILSPVEIADEIAKSVDFLESDMSDLPDRHRSIRAVFDYSWALMTDIEQQVFMKLSIFRGGFTRDAAEVVAEANLRTLMSLVNKSLIRRNADTGRYDIHELLRQYGEAMLKESGELEASREAHAHFFAELVRAQGRNIKGQQQLAALNNLEVDFENIQTAWYHLVASRDADHIQQMLEYIYLFCMFRSHLQEGQRMLDTARQQWPDSGQADLLAGRLLVRFPAADNVRAVYERGLAIAQVHQDKLEIAFCLEQQGVHLAHHNLDKEGLTLLEQSRDQYHELGEPFYVAQTLDELGWGYGLAGLNEQRATAIDECLKLRKSIGDRIGTANALRNLATADWLTRGHQADTLKYLQEAALLSYELQDRASLAWTYLIMAAVSFARGKFEMSHTKLEEGTTIAFDIRVPVLMALATILQGLEKAFHGEYHEALQLVETGLQYDNPEKPDVALTSFITLASSLAYIGLGDFEAVTRTARWMLNTYWWSLLASVSVAALNWVAPWYLFYLEQIGQEVKAVRALSAIFAHPYHDILWMEKWQPAIDLQNRFREKLGDAAYEAAWEAGKSMSIEEFIQEFFKHLNTVEDD